MWKSCVQNCFCMKPSPSFTTMMSLFQLDLIIDNLIILVSQTKCVCRSWVAGLLWEMVELAWQEFQETLVWSHSFRCSIHGHKQSLVWRICNHDASAVPVLHVHVVNFKWCSVYYQLNSSSHLTVLFIDCKTAKPHLLLVEKWVQVWVHQRNESLSDALFGERDGATSCSR